MINQKLIDRINELARKKKTVGLTEKEKEEQAKLRTIYLRSIRSQVKQHLDQIQIKEE